MQKHPQNEFIQRFFLQSVFYHGTLILVFKGLWKFELFDDQLP